MPTFSVTVNAQTAVRIQTAFDGIVNAPPPPIGTDPVVIDQKWIEAWLKDQLQTVVHGYEHQQEIAEIPPPAPIT